MMERSRTALERARGAPAESEVQVETLTVSAPECDVVLVSAEGRAFEQDNPGLRVHVVPRGWTLPPDDLRTGEADVSFLRDCFDRRDLMVAADDATPVAKQFVEYARDRWRPMAT
ncbi:hypothetical protein QF026_008210 [Streptomyces aurantiacus]|uniref:hypothetical protein n=1 Tax=Streptomyces aurantiacus TaxID=47760 RepID=UPI00279309CE|nr:hypothetical protein [Streptomyces aurantiacus]MDQ0779744.1 hypothetical protein [Streptomyces aurantiacus]